MPTTSQTIFMRLCNLLLLTLALASNIVSAQNKSTYKSEADTLVTVRSISILPVFDNLRGIYSQPTERHLIDLLSKGHRWEFVESNVTGAILTPDELESDAEAVKNLASGLSSDAFLSSSIVKGPGGIAIKMSLFLKSDQKLIAQESLTEFQSYDVDAVKRQSANMLTKLLAKLPYSGMILSRQGTRVTVNLGRADGVEADKVISVIQVIKLNRHPKFNFLVGAEKEVIGKIKLLKVDDTLSFGRIITEVEANAIQVNSKLAGLDNVVYANTDSLSENQASTEGLSERPDGKISYGANPTTWLPKKKPTFGMVGARMGIGQFAETVQSSSTSEGTDAPFYPSVSLDSELWLTPAWSMHANIRQGIIKTLSLSSYEFLMGYNMRLASSLNAPKVEGLFGYSTYHLQIDEESGSILTTKTYSGFKMGVAGSYPLPGTSPYSLGANLMFMFKPKLKESPDSSGSSEDSVNSFGFFVEKELSINLRSRFGLDFELYASDFTSGAATSSSQKHTTASIGLNYLF